MALAYYITGELFEGKFPLKYVPVTIKSGTTDWIQAGQPVDPARVIPFGVQLDIHQHFEYTRLGGTPLEPELTGDQRTLLGYHSITSALERFAQSRLELPGIIVGPISTKLRKITEDSEGKPFKHWDVAVTTRVQPVILK